VAVSVWLNTAGTPQNGNELNTADRKMALVFLKNCNNIKAEVGRFNHEVILQGPFKL